MKPIEIKDLPPDNLKLRNQANDLLFFFRDPENKETRLFLVNKDPNSERFDEPYEVYLNQVRGVLECKSTQKPFITIEYNPRMSKTEHLYLTQETFDILQRYKMKKDQVPERIIKRRMPLVQPAEPEPTAPAAPKIPADIPRVDFILPEGAIVEGPKNKRRFDDPVNIIKRTRDLSADVLNNKKPKK